MTDTSSAPHWAVTQTLRTSGRDATGKVVDGFQVDFTTTGGVSDTLFFPEAEYTVDNVRQMIASRVATHDAVGTLSG